MSGKKGVKSKRNYMTWVEMGYSEEDARFEAKKRMPGTYEYFRYFKGCDHNESLDKVVNWKEKHLKMTERNCIKRYGPVEGMKRWENYKKRQAETNTFEYKNKKYGWTEEQFREYNKSRSVTEENLVKKHGIVEGKKLWVKYIERQRYTCSEEYFIESYGAEDGLKKYNEFCYIRDNVIKQKRIGIRSIVSEELFSILDALVDEYCFWGDNEYKLVKPNGGCYHVDFFNLKTGRVIEFFGDVFHANPKIYKDENEVLFFGKTVREVRNRDKVRIKTFLEYDIVDDVHIVWEYEYRRRKPEVISYCLDFIKGS